MSWATLVPVLMALALRPMVLNAKVYTYAVIIFYSIHKLFVLYTVLEGSGSGSGLGLVEPLPEEGMLLKLFFF